MIKVYVASPYTIGNQAENVRVNILAADKLAQCGFAPYSPLLNHFWHFLCPHEPSFWLTQDLEWLVLCDCLLRLPGESKGADEEVSFCREHGIPVYYSLADFFTHYLGAEGALQALELPALAFLHPDELQQ